MTFSTTAGRAKPPRRAWYLLALLPLLLGDGGAAIYLITQISKLGDSLTQVIVPGEATLALTHPGRYMIFHERESVVDGRVYSSRSMSGLRVTLRDARGERIVLSGPAASTRYNFGGRSGVGVFQFDIARPGVYRLSAAYDDGRTQPRTVLAVGSGFVVGLLSMILVGLALAFGGLIGAGVIVAFVFTKRRKANLMAMARPGARPPTVG